MDASVSWFHVYNGTAQFYVSEDYKASHFEVLGSNDLLAPWTLIDSTQTAEGLLSFDVSSNPYTYYRLDEISVDGNRLLQGIETVSLSPAPTNAPTILSSEDSLIAEITALEAQRQQILAPAASQGLDPWKKLIIFSPGTFLAAAQSYIADYWSTWHGYSVQVISTDTFASPQTPDVMRSVIQSLIQQNASTAKNFLLLGDWNDWREYSDPDVFPSLWTSEFDRLEYLRTRPPDTSRDFIASYVVPDDLDENDRFLSTRRPYWVTDHPYADTNGDGVPDVVVTRWPIASEEELLVMAIKMQTYNDLPGADQLPIKTLLSVNHVLTDTKGDRVVEIGDLADSILEAAWSTRVNTDITTTEFRTDVVNAWNSFKPGVYVGVGRTEMVGLDPTMLPDLPIGPAFLFFPSCITAGWEETRQMWITLEIPSRAEKFVDSVLFAENKGAVALLGSSVAGWDFTHSRVTQYFLEEVVANPLRAFSRSWLVALQRLMADFSDEPTFLKNIQGYAFLGDPLTRPRSYETVTDVSEVPQTIRLELKQNTPNPFNPTTAIPFFTSKKGHVQIRIINVRGQVVTVLVDDSFAPGKHKVTWNGRNKKGRRLPSGIYFVEMRAEDRRLTRKILLAK